MTKSAAERRAADPRRQAIALYFLRDGDYARHLAARRRFVSDHNEPLASEEEIDIAIALDGWAWSMPGEEGSS